jgi:hypothetical protein
LGVFIGAPLHRNKGVKLRPFDGEKHPSPHHPNCAETTPKKTKRAPTWAPGVQGGALMDDQIGPNMLLDKPVCI